MRKHSRDSTDEDIAVVCTVIVVNRNNIMYQHY